MNILRSTLYIVPRVLAIVITIFFSAFILESATAGFTWADSFSHLLIALAMLAATLLAWKWPDTGGWLFLIVGIFYTRAIFTDAWWNGVIIGGIPLLTGFLFLAEGLLHDRYPDIWTRHVKTSVR